MKVYIVPFVKCKGDLQPIGIQFRTTTLTITVTREEFEKKNYTYRCFIYDGNVGFNDPNRVISNGVTVDPPGECIDM